MELVAANVRDTPYTAHIEVTAVSRVQEIKNRVTTKPGYIRFCVAATVIETIKGDRMTHIEYFETREDPSIGPQPGSQVVLSLQKNQDGTLFVPDNGYVFPVSDAVLNEARKASSARER